MITGTLHYTTQHTSGTHFSYFLDPYKYSRLASGAHFCNILKYYLYTKTPFANYSLLILVCTVKVFGVKGVTNAVPQSGNFRTEALKVMEFVGAAVTCGRLASAELLWAVASGKRYFLNGKSRL